MANWDLFRELDTLRREIDEAFRGAGMGRLSAPNFLGTSNRRYPLVNIAEDENNVYVEAILPGIDAKSLELSVLRNILTLSGERTPLQPEGKITWHRNERGFGRFQRTVELPADIDSSNVNAECKNGILTVTLAKAEAHKPKKISVTVQ